jgi:nitrate/nitrite transport system ATP-binding protein
LQDEIGRIWQENRKTVVLITNDVDEGLMLADRIVPLTAGPGATLGPTFAVDIPRPRDRKALNHDPRFKDVRNHVIQYLLGAGAAKKCKGIVRNLVLPDIAPEDLNAPPPMIGGRRGPIRRNEMKREAVEINA